MMSLRISRRLLSADDQQPLRLRLRVSEDAVHRASFPAGGELTGPQSTGAWLPTVLCVVWGRAAIHQLQSEEKFPLVGLIMVYQSKTHRAWKQLEQTVLVFQL